MYFFELALVQCVQTEVLHFHLEIDIRHLGYLKVFVFFGRKICHEISIHNELHPQEQVLRYLPVCKIEISWKKISGSIKITLR